MEKNELKGISIPIGPGKGKLEFVCFAIDGKTEAKIDAIVPREGTTEERMAALNDFLSYIPRCTTPVNLLGFVKEYGGDVIQQALNEGKLFV
ncbi:MAG: hypothetical protein UV63_C0046G0009 [Microgenomates group bacterium GW2011_GWC1_43_11]|uniref:Uncharacterized protein n=2 Tax=Candidatus Gottesmaniibacteriota TaxID=1752720 RepID=A0A0G1LNH5_9BACT|nr:MAG: hypothetical protein UV63_C0046G0009 [Microgenomates group bacterium GW2011_GWC1_43_11]KKT34600.1 MAG: hypothetical protein UW22_C0070G0008 [Candidatus Gottesmanbacteria bacterium GW2011_GWB1_44_11c]KKT61439.1 MAG: hypothetical protein UW52_C0003G0002 [Candidatus Gottesmanbacteria bacterium GW2011_GWA1_44_24b]HCM82719.1 hypothetical protein [Patescibacteria group bacterium]